MNNNNLRFENLDACKRARVLTNRVFALCRREALVRDYALCDQLRRASLSVMNNISEGWERRGIGDKLRFYDYSRASCGEVRPMSYVLLDNKHISEGEHDEFCAECIRAGKLVSGLLRATEERIE